MNIFKSRRRQQNDENGENADTEDRKRVTPRSVLIVFIVLIGIFVVMQTIFANSNTAIEQASPSTPKCEVAPEPYFNRSGTNAIARDGRQVYIVDGIFGDGNGAIFSNAPYIPTCDQVDGEILKTVGNLLIDVPTTDEAGNITGHERLFMHVGILGGYTQPDPQSTLSGEQQTQP